MICPYCNTGIHPNKKTAPLYYTQENSYVIDYYRCPVCEKLILDLFTATIDVDPDEEIEDQYIYPEDIVRLDAGELIYPNNHSLPFNTNYVPEHILIKYNEAFSVLAASPSSSAAISRKISEIILVSDPEVKGKDLHDRIESLASQGKYPSSLITKLHKLREIGNFAVHANGSNRSVAELVDVTPTEANLSLDILKQLIDVVYVQRKMEEERIADFEAKKEQYRALKKADKNK
jgi:hypothetical protein